MSSLDLIKKEADYGAHNYHPVPMVFSRAKGVEVWDPEGKRYLDFLSAYSAVNQGHCHPKLVQALTDQAQKCCLSSRAFYNDVFPGFAKYVTEYFGYDMVLPMNTGAEGVETAIKLARKWGYMKKGIPENRAIVFSCEGNFHGRTTGVISLSTDPEARSTFGPFLPNVGAVCPVSGKKIRYNHPEDLEEAIKAHKDHAAAFLVEPIQGEAGVVVPSDGYLKKCQEICKKYNVLFIADEIQSGLGRSGKMLACEWDGVRPDVLILGKALSGGMYPVSAVLADREVMLCIKPGEHGSTYGGNPLGCAVALKALEVLKEEKMCERSLEMGEKFRQAVRQISSPLVKEVRGRGLFNAIVIDESKSDKTAWHICVLLKEYGLLCKPTHRNIIRFSPPLVITEKELMEGVAMIEKALKNVVTMKVSDIPLVDM